MTTELCKDVLCTECTCAEEMSLPPINLVQTQKMHLKAEKVEVSGVGGGD